MGFFDDCQPNQRFQASTSVTYPGGPTTWRTTDWDQRRHISISVPERVDTDDDGQEVLGRLFPSLSGLVGSLYPDVNLVNFSIDGDFISTSVDRGDDHGLIPLYCPIEMIPEHYRSGVRVISRAELVEVDRLAPCVDLVKYKSQPESRALFKYGVGHHKTVVNWHELNCLIRLRGHPNIVPLECVVTDYQDVPESRANVKAVVGFTTAVIPAVTLQDLQKNPSLLFKKKYLEQLIKVVDDLNLRFGIVHQDIAPRNLIVNLTTDTLQLLNFTRAGKLGWDSTEGHNIFDNFKGAKIDLKGVVATVYEIITGDFQLAEQVRLDADIPTTEDNKWPRNPSVRLDTDVSHYQQTIQDWLQRRSQPENLITHYTQITGHLDWPLFWTPEIPLLDNHGNKRGEDKTESNLVWRNALRVLGLKFVE